MVIFVTISLSILILIQIISQNIFQHPIVINILSIPKTWFQTKFGCTSSTLLSQLPILSLECQPLLLQPVKLALEGDHQS